MTTTTATIIQRKLKAVAIKLNSIFGGLAHDRVFLIVVNPLSSDTLSLNLKMHITLIWT